VIDDGFVRTPDARPVTTREAGVGRKSRLAFLKCSHWLELQQAASVKVNNRP